MKRTAGKGNRDEWEEGKGKGQRGRERRKGKGQRGREGGEEGKGRERERGKRKRRRGGIGKGKGKRERERKQIGRGGEEGRGGGKKRVRTRINFKDKGVDGVLGTAETENALGKESRRRVKVFNHLHDHSWCHISAFLFPFHYFLQFYSIYPFSVIFFFLSY